MKLSPVVLPIKKNTINLFFRHQKMAPTQQRVYDISTFRRGKHIAWSRTEGVAQFYHHAIVESVDVDVGTVNCIERIRSGVQRMVHDEDDDMYLVVHSSAYSDEEVYRRAKGRLNEEGYHLKNNNCEHFANWCSTGDDRSYQAEARGVECSLCVALEKKKGKKKKISSR